MKKKFSLSLIMLTLCTSIFIGGCSCGKDDEPTNPNANVILATDISLSTSLVEDAVIGTPIEITYTINPSNTTDKTMLIQSTDTTIATVSASEVTDTLSSTITVTPVGVGTVNIVFTWNGTFDNDVESEDRTLVKATKIYVVGELGKETLNTPTGLNYANGKLSWNKVAYGTDGVTDEPKYELTLTGGATPTTPVTLDTNEYSDLVLTAGVEYTAKVKAKPSDDYQHYYTASAYSDEITIYKLNSVDSMTVANGVVTWDVVDRANKYIVNVNGTDVATISPETDATTVSFDAKSYFSDSVTSVEVKVKPICDTNDLVFDADYSINNPVIYQLGTTSGYTLARNPSDDTATLSWTPVEHATNYILEIYEVGNATAVVTETLGTTSYTIPATFAGNYAARVKAIGDTYTLDGEFSSDYSFNKQDISELTATLSNGVVSYSIVDTHDCDIVFYIVDGESTKTKTMTDATGSFNVSDVTTSTSYFITARLEPRNTSNVLVSEYAKVGHSYALSFVQNSDYTSSIEWDRLNDATNYSIEITKDDTSVKTDTVENTASGKVSYVLPTDLAVGDYEVRIQTNVTGSFAGGYSDYLNFTKLNADNLTISFSNNILTISTTDTNIGSVVVLVSGTASDTIATTLPTEIDFATKNYGSGTYTISIQALPNASTNYMASSVKEISGASVNVITNPAVASVSATGVVTWATDASYASYNVYLDKGTANEVTYLNETGNTLELNVSGLTSGTHTIYVEAVPASGYLPSSTYSEFTFTKLSTISNITYSNGVVTWDNVAEAGSYEVIENGSNKGAVNTNSYAPDLSAILMSNTYSIRPLGNGTNSISSETPTEQVINKVEAVSDLKIVDGKISWTEESDVTYKMYVNDAEVSEGKSYTFAGANSTDYTKVHVFATREGYFDSDISNIFYVKKLDKVTNITISSTNKITYTISFTGVTGASGYIVKYNNIEYPLDSSTTTLTVSGELVGGDYTITVQAISAGSTPLTDGAKSYNYLSSDVSEPKAFTKLATPTSIAIVEDVLTWTNSSTAVVSQYEIQYAPDVAGEKSWTTRALSDSTSTDMSFLTTGTTYLVKLRAVGNTAGIMSSDWSDEVSITKITTVANLKVLNGAIVWDAMVSGSNAYEYDVYVYTLDGTTEVPVGEVATITDTTYTIPAMATETAYYVKVKARNSAGIELPSEYTSALKVTKLIAPLNFMVTNHQATWTASTSYTDARYRLILTDASGAETPYDKEAGITIFDIPTTLTAKETYKLKIMAMGTTDSGSNMEGYLSSDYTTDIEIFKLASISNLRLEDGIVKWDLAHTATDAYQPVGFLIILYKNGDTVSSEDIELATNTTQLDLSYLDPGTYKIEFYVRGDGANILNSLVTVLGDSTPILKLATPSTLRMDKGMLVWDPVDASTEVNYILYNDNSQFITKTAGDEKYYPDAEVNTEYHITIKATMPGAIYSDISPSISVSKLSKVTGFSLEEGKFVWNKVENASGYRLVISYKDADVDGDGQPILDPDTGEPVMIDVETTYDIDGGNTTYFAIPETLPTTYKVERIYALGNTTSNYQIKGWFTSNATELGDTFTPLDVVTGLTTKNGSFIWNTVTGASYYAISILNSNGDVIKTDSATTNTYTVSDDVNVPAGTYTIKVTPVSTSDTYVTTNIATETTFMKLGQLDGIRIEKGYLTWNVAKSDILAAYNAGLTVDTGDSSGDASGDGSGDVSDEGGEESSKDEESSSEDVPSGDDAGSGGSAKEEFDADVYDAFYKVAVGPYNDDSNTNKLYSLAYVNLIMTNAGNNKVVRKVVQPSKIEKGTGNYVICYYFVDVEADTWNIKIGSKGNSVNVEDTTSTKFVDGVLPSSTLTATKLTSPLAPVHYDTTMIVDGLLTFTPVRRADGSVYEKYIIECVPATSPDDDIVWIEYTVTDTTDVTNQVIDVGSFTSQPGFRTDITYNINIRTLGTENSTSATGTLYLNSDTPATTALIILGPVAISVTNGELTWTMSPADKYAFELTDTEGNVTTQDLPSTQTIFSFDGDDFVPGTYKVRIQAVGNGVTKITSGWSSQKSITKLGEISTPVLNSGEFVWDNANVGLGDNGYTIVVIRTRTDVNGETIVEEMGAETLPHDDTTTSIRYSLSDSYENYVQEDTYRSVWYYSIKVKMNGSQQGSYVNGDYCVESYSYRRLNVPSNIVVTGDRITWNQVAGAVGYQVSISGTEIETGSAVDTELNVGSDNTFYLDNDFNMGIYSIKIRAIGSTPSQTSPASGYITSAYTDVINVVRVGDPHLRVERGEVLWNTVGELPLEATKYVRVTINGNTLPDIEDIANNIGFDFDNADYPAGEYTITVQFIGNSELITGDFPADDELTGDSTGDSGDAGDPGVVAYADDSSIDSGTGDISGDPGVDDGTGDDSGIDDGTGDDSSGDSGTTTPPAPTNTFYYLSSEPVTSTFTKLAQPSIALTKVVVNEGTEFEEEVNAIKWASVANAGKYDIYIVSQYTELVGEDDPATDEDEREEVTYTLVETYTPEQNGDLYGVITETGENYFNLQNIVHEQYEIYIRAVGDDTTYISSTRSESIQIHIPLAPTDFKYDAKTGTISWVNTTEASNIVLGVSTLDPDTKEYVNETFVELNPGTTTYQLGEINEYQVRIKARLKFDSANSYDSDYCDTVLTINFNLFASGDGADAPYSIADEEHLNNIRYFMNKKFVLSKDIVLDAYENWTIIGSASNPFTGQINGANYTISGFNYTDSTTAIAFVYSIGTEASTSASITNLKLDITIASSQSVRAQYFAGLAIENYGTVKNVDISGNVAIYCTNSVENQYAGAVNNNYGTIDNVVNTMTINASRTGIATYTQYTMVGGVATVNYGTITNSGNEGTLKGQYVGGIVADNYNSITRSYNKGSLEALTDGYTVSSIFVGGIAARNDNSVANMEGIISNCYVIISSTVGSSITVNNLNSIYAYAGGLVGQTYAGLNNILYSYAIFDSYTSTGTGRVRVASLVANVTTEATSYYQALSYCYAYSNLSSFVTSAGGANVTSDSLTGSAASNYSSRIKHVSALADAVGFVLIDGISIDTVTYLPKLSWEG